VPRETKVDVTKRHDCHAKCRGVTGDQRSPSAPPEPAQCPMALGDIYHGFAWQAWHFVLHGRCSTLRHLPWFCVAGVALGDICLRFAWQA